ncbi:MAG: antitoxin [Deltaproteobacteria bacterium]|nr:antitoxin [Deltaproteobacteria bacterium]
MSKRLQVLVEPREYRVFQQMALAAGVSLGEWVRQVLRRIATQSSQTNPTQKVARIRRAAEHRFPTADIDQMLREIESGYVKS